MPEPSIRLNHIIGERYEQRPRTDGTERTNSFPQARHSAAPRPSENPARRSRQGRSKQSRSRQGNSKNPRPKKKETFAHALAMLLIKIGIIIAVFVCLFTIVFGLFRINDASMNPTMKPGDLVLTYRLQDPVVGDVVAFSYKGQVTMGRVVATAGNTVDITDDGLTVNNIQQQEEGIYSETTQFQGGVTMPLTVPDNSVFVLGDNRANATDSRIFGCVDKSDLQGVAVSDLRIRKM